MGTDEARELSQALADLRVELREERAEVRAELRELRKGQDALMPILMARSGDEQRIGELERDVRASHDKHRGHFERFKVIDETVAAVASRVSRVEARVAVVVGGLMFVWELVKDHIPGISG